MILWRFPLCRHFCKLEMFRVEASCLEIESRVQRSTIGLCVRVAVVG